MSFGASIGVLRLGAIVSPDGKFGIDLGPDGIRLLAEPYSASPKELKLGSSGQLLLPDGSASAPALAFGSAPTFGAFYQPSNSTLQFASGGTKHIAFGLGSGGGGVIIVKDNPAASTNGLALGATPDAPDVVLRRDAADTLALRRSTNAQRFNIGAADAAGRLAMGKDSNAAFAPGAGFGMLRWEPGTNPGTLKLVAYAGTSSTGVTIVDNVGAGN